MYWDILDLKKKSAAAYQDDEDETSVNISPGQWSQKEIQWNCQLVLETEN